MITFLVPLLLSTSSAAPPNELCGDGLTSLTNVRFESESNAKMHAVQLSKHRSRNLEDYDRYIMVRAARPRPFHKLLAHARGRGPSPRWLLAFVESLARHRGGRLRWSDVGAGYAVPFRQIKRGHPALADLLEMTAVDLFDWRRLGDPGEESLARQEAGEDIMNEEFKPRYRIGDLRSVTPDHQDLITSIESIQYVDDKAGAIVDLYNRLAPGGLLIIVTEHHWSYDLAYQNLGYFPEHHSVLQDIVDHLGLHGIPVGTIQSSPRQITSLAILRPRGTRLRLETEVGEVRTKRDGYRFSFYPVRLGQSPIAVERTRNLRGRGHVHQNFLDTPRYE